MMDWMQFLEDRAIDCVMTPDQRRAFLARFDPLNASKTDKWIAENIKDERGDRVFAGEPAFKKLMTAVYKAVQKDLFPELAEAAKGKKEKLEALLKESWRSAPQPPILGVPSQEKKGEEDEGEVQSPPELGDLGGENVGRSTIGLKPGAPMPRVRLPDNFVGRSDALLAVKEKLLLESEQTLVVSAIAGLGGLGKSVLATAIVLDTEVQGRFEDGILWVTLGQNPDLQSCLGDLIRELDKSRDSFSATTLESASGYLHNLLAERRMLLVVDDVWNAAHAEWFRVGGAGCRVLVTTREAQIEGAEVYLLALMSEGEAIDLVRQKLGRSWKAADEAEVRSFARVLGYLPLALDLAANLVRDGLGWGELQAEFEDERRAVLLEILDTSESFELMSEKDREKEERKHSLKACFNLSLKRLSAVQLRQFAWLGVLPEDVDLSGTIAEVLWDVKPIWAKRGLSDLRNRSFLTDGVQTVDGVATYRVHDLMHDTARGLIEKGELGIENLEMAQGAFLERYRGRSGDGSWYGLANDGYIYRHLTWHLEMAGQLDAVHELMASGEDQNDWFEACDKIGQPGIFVEDVRRGWRLAEELYETDRGRAIVLQCRYALIMGTLNSLFQQMPVELFEAALKHGFLTIEEVWSYIQGLQDSQQFADIVLAIIPYLSLKIAELILEKIEIIKNESSKADILHEIAKKYPEICPKIVEIAKFISSKIDYGWILIGVGRHDTDSRIKAYEESKFIDSQFFQYFISSKSEIDKEVDFEEGVRLSRPRGSSSYGETDLSEKASSNPDIFQKAWEDAKKINDLDYQASSMITILKYNEISIPEVMKLIEKIQKSSIRDKLISRINNRSNEFSNSEVDRFSRRDRLVAEYIRKSDPDSISVYWLTYKRILNTKNDVQFIQEILNDIILMSDDLQTGRIQEGTDRAWGLIALAQRSIGMSEQIFEVATSLKNDSGKAEVFCALERDLPEHFLDRVLVELGKITHLPTQAKVLSRYISRLSLATLRHTDWTTYLHLLVHRTRADLMGDLATLYPTILHLGGEEAGRGMVGEMGRICKQWK